MPLQITRADGGGADAGQAERVSVGANAASPDYFAVMGIPMRRGRSFAAGDLKRPAPAVVLSEHVARTVFGSDDPIGRRISMASDAREAKTFEVVGVAGDVPAARIEDGAAPMLYFPLLPDGDGLGRESFPLPIVPRTAQHVVRGTVLPTAAQIRSVVRALDARVPAMAIQPVARRVESATARVRLTMLLLGVASAGALLLGIIGVYSVVAYAAEGRAREFGVRLALGATPQRVMSMVLGDGAAMAGMGIAAGVLVALAGTRLLQSLLYGVSATSTVEFTVATAVVALVTVAATLVPAWRAARTDPAVVLRGE
jgi:putative ABC transport system permease protein